MIAPYDILAWKLEDMHIRTAKYHALGPIKRPKMRALLTRNDTTVMAAWKLRDQKLATQASLANVIPRMTN